MTNPTHAEALEAAYNAFRATPVSKPIRDAVEKAIAAYLAARGCVLMPREMTDEMINVVRDEETKYAKDGEGFIECRNYAALIAHVEFVEEADG